MHGEFICAGKRIQLIIAQVFRWPRELSLICKEPHPDPLLKERAIGSQTLTVHYSL